MKHEILTSNGIPVHLVRYFNYQSKNYLIFTRESEADEQGYVTINISEVVNEGGLSAIVVDDQTSKDIVKIIANANKNNIPLDIVDLDYNDIDGINILGDKAYRVLPNYVEILSKNRTVFDKTNVEQPSIEITNNDNELPTVETENNEFVINNSIDTDNNPFNINQQFVSEINENVSENNMSVATNTESVTDYQKLYLEQQELVKNLNSEIEIYKNKIEMLKNIINN